MCLHPTCVYTYPGFFVMAVKKNIIFAIKILASLTVRKVLHDYGKKFVSVNFMIKFRSRKLIASVSFS